MDFEAEYGDLPTRPMRVKVLYSFDRDHKTNCLARFSQTLQIPTVAIDESSQVGVIELQQCLETIITASPELLSQLSTGDFTIYAYDYSEHDTPLVGQGMLSAALAGSPNAVGSEKVMITGRVCKNVPAIFSGGVKETLEVKLRLTPVSKPVQSTKSQIEETRSVSPATSAGFDPNAWNASRPQRHTNDFFNFESGTTPSERDLALMDEMLGLGSASGGSGVGQQMGGEVGMAETPTDATLGPNPALSHSGPGSRAGSPMIRMDSNNDNELLRRQNFAGQMQDFTDQSRPTSRNSARSEVQPPRHQYNASTQSMQQPAAQQQTEVFYNEDGQPRKRAKVTQTDWHGRSSFGAKSGDLRVTAATAHSMQMHRPIAKRAAISGSELEPPPRAPTPVPQGNPMRAQQRRPPPAQTRSFLRQASTATMESDYMSDIDQFSDAVGQSPEEDNTPLDIPSSPPVFQPSNQPQPSSPGLPTLPAPKFADSGYLSERGHYSSNMMDDYNYDDNEDRSPDAQDLEVAAQYNSRRQNTAETTDATPSEMNVELEAPGDMGQLPHKMLLNLPPGRQPAGDTSSQPRRPPLHKAVTDGTALAVSAACSDERKPQPEAAQSRRSSLALPSGLPSQNSGQTQAPALAPGQKPKRKYTKRARPAAEGSEAGSPAPSDTEGGRPSGPTRSGSGAKRSVVIQQRLEASLHRGEMPQYCNHCGAIETPTWRKLYFKYVDGKPSALDEAEGAGETIGVEPLEWEGGEVSRFLIRKSMKRTKENGPGKDFEEVTVCNPCGLWFNKFRAMRPSDRWGRKSGTRRTKKKQFDGSDMPATDGAEPQPEAFFSEMPGPDDFNVDPELKGEDQSVGRQSEERQSEERQSSASNPRGTTQGSFDVPRAPAARPRASSLSNAGPHNSGRASRRGTALAREVQSSPVRFVGSQQSPIEVEDLTPKPTRRLLFPSPRNEGQAKSLGDSNTGVLSVAARATNPDDHHNASLKPDVLLQASNVSVFDAFTLDKENRAPGFEADDDVLAHLFEGSPNPVFKTPSKAPAKAPLTTPRSQRQQSDQLLKTPTPSSRKRKALSPNQDHAVNDASKTMNDCMTSPSSSRYFLRSTPSREARTPNRLGQSAGEASVEMTPFSRHIAQMLSDATASGNGFSSPSQAFDFSDMPPFMSGTPGKQLDGAEWPSMGDIMSSDFAALGSQKPEGNRDESL
ncbi:hypothetical protein KC340_g10414 [Hortaea werneckii]|nr:hypothetical protein KC342_g9199 [Hortaea werneckii]KAI7096416.1 hypothetical protein KC339_g10401 [Hortaea werneckii]KAI7216952.1 hypothetical protein KC365_g13096 [Hortaea werneckii]KAI7310704.1 hypothetical protein KC340_g10414 [Hortaea werneckii]KAI7378151.1 hypothetical protein KC328_g14044 [Hortaea werneckii]